MASNVVSETTKVTTTVQNQTENPSIQTLLQDVLLHKNLKNKKMSEAYINSIRILEKEPKAFQSHTYLGVLLDNEQKPEDALKSLLSALEIALEKAKSNPRSEYLYMAYYNLGFYYGSVKKIESAIENYQKALDIFPSAIEPKHNIELLVQDPSGGKGKGSSNQSDKGDDKNKDQEKNKGDSKSNDKKDQNAEYEKGDQQKNKPYQGNQLSESDVKKILGELEQQDKKIRSQYNQKQRKEDKNEKDW